MKKALLFLFLFLPFLAAAQNYPKNPDTGLIAYSEVVPMEGKTQKEVYDLARQWVATAFNSAQHVIQMDNQDRIVAKGNTEYIYETSMGGQVADRLQFTLTIEFKDGRYKYEATNFKTAAGHPIEDVLYKPGMYKKDGTVRNAFQGMFTGIESAMKSVGESLKKGMTTNASKSDW